MALQTIAVGHEDPRSSNAQSSILMPMERPSTFEELVREGDLAAIDGWDFSWLNGRASEERPSWRYSGMLASALTGAHAALDIQTGGGEVLAEVLTDVVIPPDTLAATESWQPNLEMARSRLSSFSVLVVEVSDDADLPFVDCSFDLVVSRHPTVVLWNEIARVLRPGGRYLSQQIGPGSNRELTDFMMGPQPVNLSRSPERTNSDAEVAGLVVDDLRHEALRVTFGDIGAVIYFLRKVIWTVPGFTSEGYCEQLARLHDRIEREGVFVTYAQRLLVQAHKRV